MPRGEVAYEDDGGPSGAGESRSIAINSAMNAPEQAEPDQVTPRLT